MDRTAQPATEHGQAATHDEHMREVTEDRADPRGRQADQPSEIPARGWKDIARRVKRNVAHDHLSLAAAGVAFYGFLAVIPALAALVSLAGLLLAPDEVVRRTEDLFANLPDEAHELLTAQLESLAGRSGNSLSLGLVVSVALSLWSASSGMGHLVEAVNVAYNEYDERGFLRKRALAVALTLGAVVFVVFTVTGLAALPSIVDALEVPEAVATAIGWLFWPVLALAFAVGLSVIYRYGPDRDDPEWRWVSLGSVVAVALWIAASVGFRLYAANFGSYDESYGSLAAVVVLLLWLLITAFVVLLGAEINAETEHQTSHDTTTGTDEPMGHRGAEVADTVGATSEELG